MILINLVITLVILICGMLSKVYKTLRYLPASISAMCEHIEIPSLKRKHSDSSEMSYADVTKRGTPLQSGPSGGRNSGQGNRSHQGPPVREDRRSEQSHTSFDHKKSNRGGNRGRGHGHHDNTKWDKGGRDGNNSKQARHSDRGGRERFQTSHDNYRDRNQGYTQRDSNFVYEEPGSSVDHQTFHHQTSATSMAQRSRQNSESKDFSAWNTTVSHSTTPHSPSDSSVKSPSSESPPTSHSLSGSGEMSTQGSNLTEFSNLIESSPPSDLDRRPLPATPMKSLSLSGPTTQLGSETKEKTNSSKEGEKSGLSGAVSDAERNKRPGSRQNSESKDFSAWNKAVPHSTSDSSAKSPSSESPTTSHSLSGSGEMSTQGSNLIESSPPSDLDRRPLPATPMKSLSLSDPTTQLGSETKGKKNSSKEGEKSGSSGAVSGKERKKRSRSKDKAQGFIGPVLKDTKKFESEKVTSVSKGVPKSQLRRAPECLREYASLQAAGNESADYQSDRPENREPRGKNLGGVPSFVLLPHESRAEFGQNFRWENIFRILNSKINNYWDLEKAMLQISAHNPISNRSYGQYNPNERADYRTLQAYFKTLTEQQLNHFFQTTLPRMQVLALRLPQLFKEGLPILKQRVNMEINLSQHQAACLLANAFFNTIPERPRNFKEGKPLQMPEFNFINLYSQAKSERKIEKLKCIMNYFDRVTQKMPEGNVTFKRVYSPTECWKTMETKLTNLHVSTEGSIEDEKGFLQADFANKFVGGGVLNTGLVQEEIRFVLCPEMIVSRLITEMLTNDEVLVMIGCERFNDYSGYSDSFKFTRNYVDPTERDEAGRMYTEVVAMDASVFRDDFYEQFKMHHVLRELNKAHCAFKRVGAANESAVCTGNWGCGAFGGDTQLKALIQLMAASAAGRDICYLTFGDADLCLQIGHIYDILKTRDMSIKDIMKILEEYSHSNTSDTVFKYIEDTITGNLSSLEKSTTFMEKTIPGNVSRPGKSTKFTESAIPGNVSRPEKSTSDVPKDPKYKAQSKSPSKHTNK